MPSTAPKSTMASLDGFTPVIKKKKKKAQPILPASSAAPASTAASVPKNDSATISTATTMVDSPDPNSCQGNGKSTTKTTITSASATSGKTNLAPQDNTTSPLPFVNIPSVLDDNTHSTAVTRRSHSNRKRTGTRSSRAGHKSVGSRSNKSVGTGLSSYAEAPKENISIVFQLVHPKIPPNLAEYFEFRLMLSSLMGNGSPVFFRPDWRIVSGFNKKAADMFEDFFSGYPSVTIMQRDAFLEDIASFTGNPFKMQSPSDLDWSLSPDTPRPIDKDELHCIAQKNSLLADVYGQYDGTNKPAVIELRLKGNVSGMFGKLMENAFKVPNYETAASSPSAKEIDNSEPGYNKANDAIPEFDDLENTLDKDDQAVLPDCSFFKEADGTWKGFHCYFARHTGYFQQQHNDSYIEGDPVELYENPSDSDTCPATYVGSENFEDGDTFHVLKVFGHQNRIITVLAEQTRFRKAMQVEAGIRHYPQHKSTQQLQRETFLKQRGMMGLSLRDKYSVALLGQPRRPMQQTGTKNPSNAKPSILRDHDSNSPGIRQHGYGSGNNDNVNNGEAADTTSPQPRPPEEDDDYDDFDSDEPFLPNRRRLLRHSNDRRRSIHPTGNPDNDPRRTIVESVGRYNREARPGANWRWDFVGPRTELTFDAERGTISPWTASRLRHQRTCHAVQLKLHHMDYEEFMASFSEDREYNEKEILSSFMKQFPAFNGKSAEDVLMYYNLVVGHAARFGVFIPPPHTLVDNREFGAWFEDLPDNVKALANNTTGGHLLQALKQKQVNLIGDPQFGGLLAHTSDGYEFLWTLLSIGGHPNFSDKLFTNNPTQAPNMTVPEYIARWQHFLYRKILEGQHYSDRYFLEEFRAGLSPEQKKLADLLHTETLQFNAFMFLDMPLPPQYGPQELLLTLNHIAVANKCTELLTKAPSAISNAGRSVFRNRRPRSVNNVSFSFIDNIVSDLPETLIAEQEPLTANEIVDFHVYAVQESNGRACHLCSSTEHLLNDCPQAQSIYNDRRKRAAIRTYLSRQRNSHNNANGPQNINAVSDTPSPSNNDGDNDSVHDQDFH